MGVHPDPLIRRITLVPKAERAPSSGPRIRRFSLAGLGPSPRSALGEDRHARLERAAGHDR